MRTVDEQEADSMEYVVYFVGGGTAAVTFLLTGSVLGCIVAGVAAGVVGLVIGLLYLSIRG